jgi:hypothetical protein
MQAHKDACARNILRLHQNVIGIMQLSYIDHGSRMLEILTGEKSDPRHSRVATASSL